MSEERYYQLMLQTPIGWLGVEIRNGTISRVDLLDRPAPVIGSADAVAVEARRQIEAYFRNPEATLNLPFTLRGSEFQLRVWRELCQIPAGEVRSYGELARHLKSSARAVGNACRANPIPILIPCHRVIAAQGIGGYSGATDGPELARKRWLLNHEGVCL